MYYKNLDPLRGFLALMVVVFHLNYFSINVGLPNLPIWSFLNKGTEAVLVFFVLSGYLIIGQLWDEKSTTGTIAIRDFYLRRILRLYPVYYTVLLFGIGMYYFLVPALGWGTVPSHSIGEALLYNILFLPNVFKHVAEPGSILEILWSIGIEEQFYLAIAPLFAFIPTKRIFALLTGFTFLYFGLYHLPQLQFLADFTMLFFFMSAGGVMALLQRHNIVLYGNNRWAKLIIYIAFLGVFFTDVFYSSNDMLKHAAYLIIFTLMVPTLAHDENFRGVSAWSTKLGKISYGIYMFHMIVVNFVLYLGGKLQGAGVAQGIILAFDWIGTIGLTVLSAYLSYTYFEMPFLKLKNRFRGRATVSKLHKAP